MIHYVLRALLFITSLQLLAETNLDQLQLAIEPENDSYKQLILDAVKESFLLTKLSCESDIKLDHDEFLYLVDFKEHQLVKPSDIVRAVFHLVKKNKFSTITLLFKRHADGFHLHCQLLSFWTLRALKLHGFMFGKEAYRHLYLIEPGERFNEQKHLHSLGNLKEALHAQGYCNAHIATTFDRDERKKNVTVHLKLDRGNKFSIGKISATLNQSEGQDAELQGARIEVLRYLNEHLGHGTYNKQHINEVVTQLKKLLAARGFFQVTVELDEKIHGENNSIDLTFTIKVGSQKQCNFIGNTSFTAEQLLDQILLFGDSLYSIPVFLIKDELESFYRSAGFWDVAIEVLEQNDKAIIMIKEGACARITHVQLFNGLVNKEIDKIIAKITKRVYADEAYTQEIIDELIDYYKAHGYVAARIAKREYVKNNPHVATYTLLLTIDQGAHYNLCAVKIPGYEHLLLTGPFAYQTYPTTCTQEIIEKQQAWLINYFKIHKLGIESIKPVFRHQDTTVELTWVIEQQKDVHFGKTILSPITTLPFSVVKRELEYKDNEPWDRDKLTASMVRLKALNIFDSVHFYPSPFDDREKAVVLTLRDDDPFEIRTRVGFGLQQVSPRLTFGGITYKVGGTFIAKNPFNCGDHFRFDGDILRSYRMMRIEYVRPWIFDVPIKTIIAGYNNKYQQPGFKHISENLYDVIQQGLQLCFKRSFAGVTSGINMGFEYLETAVGSDESSRLFALEIARAINFDPRLLDRKIPFMQAEPTIVVDRLSPNKLEPSQGTLTVASIKGMFPFGRTHGETFFIKLLLDHSWFVPIKSAVLATRFRFGHIFHHHFNTIMPSERFYLGGANSIRSYETDLCPPLGTFVNACGKAQVVPQGGKTMANFMIEARIPLYKKLTGVVFQDVGFLSKNLLADFTIHGVLMGTGFGLHYSTPIGPLRFEIGFKGDKDPTHLSYAWFLTFGNAF